MKAKIRIAIISASVFAAACATPEGTEPAPVLAITIDDLPVHGPYPRGESALTATNEVLTALKAERVEAYGFVNAVWTERDPATAEALKAWVAAGQPLANHGFAHRHLSEMSAAKFEQELVKNEPALERLSGGKDWKWFRYPFIDEGESPEKRTASRAILAKHGYKIADVTMDFSDWAWTAPYARCRDAGDEKAVTKLEQMYLQAAREGVAYHRAQSRQDRGRDIPYVLLLHISAFEGRMFPQLLKLYRDEGFRFVTLAEAQSDPVYRAAMDPRLPAFDIQSTGALPSKTNYQPILEGMCKS